MPSSLRYLSICALFFVFAPSSSFFCVIPTLKQFVMSVPTRLWSVRSLPGTAAANPGLPMGYAGCLCSGLWPTAGDRNGKGLSGGFGGQHYLIPLPFLSRDFPELLGLPIRCGRLGPKAEIAGRLRGKKVPLHHLHSRRDKQRTPSRYP